MITGAGATPVAGRRTYVLRQAGLVELCARGSTPTGLTIALIDGAVDVGHPSFRGCRISTIGEAAGGRAGAHATFNASILLACEEDRGAGRALGICAGCSLLNIAAVTDPMLTTMPIGAVAAVLAAAVGEAVRRRSRVILFGVEIRGADSPQWAPLRESLRAAARAGAVAILPAGNRTVSAATAVCWPEVLVATSHGARGAASTFSPPRARCSNMIAAPGEDIPGAGEGSGYTVRSGTSFAAAVAAGAIARAAAALLARDIFEVAAALCRPPARVLDAAGLMAAWSSPEREELHATADA